MGQYLPSLSQSKPLLHKIGLYTSPHLRFVRERIQINNQPLSEEIFAKYFFDIWDRLEDAAKARGEAVDVTAKPVYFRFLTLMAFHTYMSEGVDTAVIECGVGGEYDSTNIVTAPTVTGITSLGIDHVAMLGNTIEEIAWHKAGIMKVGAPAFTSPQPVEALRVLENRAAEKATPLKVVEKNPQLSKIKLGLAADFQVSNAALAVAVASAHLQALGHPITRSRELEVQKETLQDEDVQMKEEKDETDILEEADYGQSYTKSFQGDDLHIGQGNFDRENHGRNDIETDQGHVYKDNFQKEHIRIDQGKGHKIDPQEEGLHKDKFHSAFTLPPEFIHGLQNVHWPGRCETRHEANITWHIDGGHTLESIEAAGRWFASQIHQHFQPGHGSPCILIFNQQTRDAGALARALHRTLATALHDDRPFAHAIFCPNLTFRDAGYSPDLVSVNTNAQEVKQLEVQKRLAATWGEIDSQAKVAVVGTIEEAVERVREIAKGEGEVRVLVTGSLHLVGGFLDVLERR